MLRLICPEVKEQPEAKPCPICGGKDLKVHQTITRWIKDSVVQKVVIKRMECEGCHYTFRSYPEGVRAYSGRSKRLVFLGVILYLAGLSYEKCQWFLEGLLGRRLVDMVTIWRDIQALGKKSRSKLMNFPNGTSLVIGLDGTYFKVKGEEVPTIFATDAKGGITIWFDTRSERDKVEIRKSIKALAKLCHIEAVITDDWELYKEPLEERGILHQVCLGHMKKNFKRRLSRIKEGCLEIKGKLKELIEAPELSWGALCQVAKDDRLWLKENIKLREIVAALLRKWKHYTAYRQNPGLPTSNNVTERAILLSKVRYRTTRGLKSLSGLSHFITMTQMFGLQRFSEIAADC
jgi:transposase-like protein